MTKPAPFDSTEEWYEADCGVRGCTGWHRWIAWPDGPIAEHRIFLDGATFDWLESLDD